MLIGRSVCKTVSRQFRLTHPFLRVIFAILKQLIVGILLTLQRTTIFSICFEFCWKSVTADLNMDARPLQGNT